MGVLGRMGAGQSDIKEIASAAIWGRLKPPKSINDAAKFLHHFYDFFAQREENSPLQPLAGPAPFKSSSQFWRRLAALSGALYIPFKVARPPVRERATLPANRGVRQLPSTPRKLVAKFVEMDAGRTQNKSRAHIAGAGGLMTAASPREHSGGG